MKHRRRPLTYSIPAAVTHGFRFSKQYVVGVYVYVHKAIAVPVIVFPVENSGSSSSSTVGVDQANISPCFRHL